MFVPIGTLRPGYGMEFGFVPIGTLRPERENWSTQMASAIWADLCNDL